jgi:peptidoglycan-associated lipoprotein
MKTQITVIAATLLFLSGCQTSPTMEEIKNSEDILLKEDNVPVMIGEQEIADAKINILKSDGFVSINEIEIPEAKKMEIFDNKIIDFGFDKYELTAKNKKIIDIHVEFLKENNMIKIIVEGHTDERGEKSYNLTLGEKRADAVKNYMLTKGILSGQVEIISYGETKPSNSASTKKAWSENRRSIFVYN